MADKHPKYWGIVMKGDEDVVDCCEQYKDDQKHYCYTTEIFISFKPCMVCCESRAATFSWLSQRETEKGKERRICMDCIFDVTERDYLHQLAKKDIKNIVDDIIVNVTSKNKKRKIDD